jgi:retinol dehydrogenase 12
MSRPIALLTGATDGIGRAAAVALARRGHDVLIVGRDEARAEAARAEVQAVAGAGVRVEALLADLESLDEVRRLASEVRERTDRVDVLANNAGAIFTTRRLTVDGLEQTMALNHFAPLVLTLELLPLLQAGGGPARIVNTASTLHARGRVDADDLDLERGRWLPPLAYGTAKLALMLSTRELARRLTGTGVVAHTFHPGVVRTGFGKKDARYLRTVWKTLGPALRTPERGARTLVFLATADEALTTSGGYWVDERPATPAPRALDDGLAARLWDASVDRVGVPAAA